MTVVPQIVLLLAVFIAVWWLTGRFRRYALERQMLDIPNPRSSHSVATPRGGGVAIALVLLIALPVAGLLGALSWSAAWSLLGGGALVAVIGFVDDHGHLARRWRLFAHICAATWAVWWIGGLPDLDLPGLRVESTWLAGALGVLYVVWILNLTNFMD